MCLVSFLSFRAQDVPPEVLRQREVKWLDMLSHWDKWIMKRFNKVSLKFESSDRKCQLNVSVDVAEAS